MRKKISALLTKMVVLGMVAAYVKADPAAEVAQYLDKIVRFLTSKTIAIPAITIMLAVGAFELLFSRNRGWSGILYAVIGGILLLGVAAIIRYIFGG